MENYDNLIEALEGLKKQGYTEDFNLQADCIEYNEGANKIWHDEFNVDKYFRFEGDSDPEDESVIYAISSDKYQVKGILINSFGTYSDPLTDEMLMKLK